ncbi:Clp protease N-terminal domain-containing protein [Actinokineospora cianjurensis]|uniref:ClpA/ClpB-like protein n=1 Tax=Actinokineospora cianjurensis TaxID=585224 RepID=A0A421B7V7_9PSEU|nr:Clp protease N-terminal domain-containing protein [Actinokineospora cianjurensis]RLK60586.1 ClpA/ClpB-like protein [Actinokineospora cianjurensis]
MFERFTSAARVVVRDGVYLAEQDEAARIEPEHLLLALLKQDGSRGTDVLTHHAVTTASAKAAIDTIRRRGGLSEADAAALGEFGIDVEAVVAAVEETHGAGALSGTPKRPRSIGPRWRVPFSRDAKRVLEFSLREALARGDKSIGDEHVLLALLKAGGVAAEALTSLGVTHDKVSAYLSTT